MNYIKKYEEIDFSKLNPFRSKSETIESIFKELGIKVM